jgi:hypothetical protein
MSAGYTVTQAYRTTLPSVTGRTKTPETDPLSPEAWKVQDGQSAPQ